VREGRIALVMAPVCGIAAWGLVTVFFPLFNSLQSHPSRLADASRVSLAVGTAMTSAILLAAFLGIALPFTFRRLGVDPAIASGPLVTTLNDIASVSVYMVIAVVITG
jgi:magnesium transporter